MDWASTAITVITSSLTSGFVTFALNTKQQERSVRRAKLEELCSLLHRQQVQLKALAREAKAAVNDPSNSAELERLMTKVGVDDNTAHERVEALIAIYFPSLASDFDLVRALARSREDSSLSSVAENMEQVQRTHSLLRQAAIKLASSVSSPLWKFWA